MLKYHILCINGSGIGYKSSVYVSQDRSAIRAAEDKAFYTVSPYCIEPL